MKLSFGGYGGEYCCGEVDAIDNITELLKRFDENLIFGYFDIFFDSSDWPRQYYDFDELEHVSSVALNARIYIEDTGDSKLDEDVFDTDELTTKQDEPITLKDGWYLSSASIEKGNFFEVELDIKPEDFDKSKLVIFSKDLDSIGFGDLVITSVEYDGVDLELNYDSLDTNGKAFEQSLIRVHDGFHYEGVEAIMDTIPEEDMFEIIDDVEGLDREDVIYQYLEFINAAKSGYLLKVDHIIVWVSPFLYKHFDKDEVDKLWLTEKNIKFALKNNYRDAMPDDIFERAINRFPEWLI